MSKAPSHQKNADGANHIRLTVKAPLVPLFFPLLQEGFTRKIKAGCSVRSLLSDQFGLSAEYIENRIQTIFLNGKPIDDMDAAIVRDGSILALSSALPGVLGATLRRGGYYSRMRSQITHVEDAEAPGRTDGRIIVKLFNLTIRELGPVFLERGIWIEGQILKEFFRSRSNDWGDGCVEAVADGSSVDLRNIPYRDLTDPLVHLQVRAA
ncbi:MAG: hypothetical protein H6Q04_1757 [Acidobacteria bacterium]|nr:hypothetical protein [Acidobacteriota bacterium]